MPGIDQHHLDAGQVFEEVVAQIQDWVTTAKYQGLSPRSIKKYHVLLSSILPDADQRNLDALDRITHRRE